MSACPDEGLLLALSAGQLPEADAAPLHGHLDSCPSCLALLGDLLRVGGTAGDAEDGALQPGQRAGSYRIERWLGQGAMGVVYLAVHEQIGRRAALKVLRREVASDPRLAQRLLAEARLVNQIGHPALVQIFDYIALPDGAGAIVMEYLPGVTLGAHVRGRGGRLPEGEARALCAEVAAALSAAHRCGVVHRDIKPDNVMLTPDPRASGRHQVRLLDFGLAKVLETEEGASFVLSTLTAEGEIVGTPAYLAPEQIDASGSVDGRADVYALGATLYHVVAGRPPFSGSPLSVLRAHLSEEPRPLRERAPGASPMLEALLQRMLAKDPAGRPTMAEAAALLAPVPSAL